MKNTNFKVLSIYRILTNHHTNAILGIIRDNYPICVKDIEIRLWREKNISIDQSTVSRKIGDLRRLNLVRFTKEGKHKFYRPFKKKLEFIERINIDVIKELEIAV